MSDRLAALERENASLRAALEALEASRKGPYPKVPKDKMRPLLVEMRAQGKSAKEISKATGYSHTYISHLAKRLGIATCRRKGIAPDHCEE